MKIEVLGPGCAKCETLALNVQQAVDRVGVDCEIVKVTDITEIMKRGVMMTPGLVVDGEVKASGKSLTVEDIIKLIAPDS